MKDNNLNKKPFKYVANRDLYEPKQNPFEYKPIDYEPHNPFIDKPRTKRKRP